MRNILDEIGAAVLFPIFNSVYQALQAKGYLKSYQYNVSVIEGVSV